MASFRVSYDGSQSFLFGFHELGPMELGLPIDFECTVWSVNYYLVAEIL